MRALLDIERPGRAAAAEKKHNVVMNPAEKITSTICFLERVAESSGNFMPDMSEIHLLFFLKRQVYKHFQREYHLLYADDPSSSSYFVRRWKQAWCEVKVRKINRFLHCALCVELDTAIRRALKSSNDTYEFSQQSSVDVEMVMSEHFEYKKIKKRQHYVQIGSVLLLLMGHTKALLTYLIFYKRK